jgi:hypothetical protein
MYNNNDFSILQKHGVPPHPAVNFLALVVSGNSLVVYFLTVCKVAHLL